MYEINVENALTEGVEKISLATQVKGERLGKGWPDRIVLAWPRKIAFVELKRLDGKMGRRQKAIRKLLISLGFDFYCLYTREEVENWLSEWFS